MSLCGTVISEMSEICVPYFATMWPIFMLGSATVLVLSAVVMWNVDELILDLFEALKVSNRRPQKDAKSPSNRDSRIVVNGAEVPSALASAFKDPRKDKRPFSYFKTGAPDLSEKPSPSSVRKTNPHIGGGPAVPKVLPIVSEDELEVEEARSMPYSHLQYNSPLNLYSNHNVEEAIQQQTGSHSPGKKPDFNIEDSATYKLIHEMDSGAEVKQTSPSQSRYTAQYFDPPTFRVKEEDYPHYQGHVNPYVQSPSFKKLQMSTVGANMAADDAASRAQSAPTTSPRHSIHGHSERPITPSIDSMRFTGIDRQDMNPSPSFHHIQRMTGSYTDNSGQLYGPVKTELHSPGQTGGRAPPNWAMKDPTEDRRDHNLDPMFAAQIAQAEQPNVPQQRAPDWAQTAAVKRDTWDRRPINPDEQRRPRYAAGADVEPNWSAAAQQNAAGLNPYQDEYYKKHYPTGSEVRPNWGKGSQNPVLTQDELYRKHYAAGAEVQPEWSRASRRSQDKWESHYGGSLQRHQGRQAPQAYQPQQQQQQPQYQHAPQPQYQQQAYQPAPQPQYQQQSYQPVPQPYHSPTSPRPRARSTEPPNWRASQPSRQMYTSQTLGRQKDSWLKPYIAPNIEGRSGARTPGPLMQSRSERTVPSSVPHHNAPLEFGSYYGPERGGFYSGPRTYGRSLSSSSYRASNYNYSQSQAQTGGAIHRPQEIGGRDYYTLPAPKKQITPASLMSGQADKPGPVDQVVPAWQETAEYKRQLYEAGQVQEAQRPQPYEPVPNWAQTANQKRNLWEAHSTHIDPQVNRQPLGPEPPPMWAHKADQTRSLYDHEADALKQRGMMETELQRRSQQSYQSSQQTYRGGGPNESGTFTTVTSGPVAKPLWQQAQGASTKSHASGTYKDPQGHDVAYKKEVYTTSDPGKEFQMQTEEEKKIFEEPVQPGVLSRHTTTKYYKKSTYNSTSTTSTTQAPPSYSFTPMPVTLGPPGPIREGVTQF